MAIPDGGGDSLTGRNGHPSSPTNTTTSVQQFTQINCGGPVSGLAEE
jgi:hypothetical protein